jgi:hypothetical protein
MAQSNATKIRTYIAAHLDAKPDDVAKKFGTKRSYVYALRSQVMRDVGKPKRKYTRQAKPQWQTVAVVSSNTPMPVTMQEPASDPVNQPAHYKVGGVETIDFIEAKNLNYNLGNAVKYITRADHKGNRKQDLEKALWYIKRELSHA